MTFPELSDITWGGFIKSNIRNSLIDDCLSSGDPQSMFLAIQEAVDNISMEIVSMDTDEFWENEMLNWKEGSD